MLTLADLRLGLRDLFEKRHAELMTSKAGKFYEEKLAEQRDSIEALPPLLTFSRPLAGEIDALDAKHDDYGAMIYLMTGAYLRHPAADPELTASAGRIRDAFIPTLEELTASYVTEADRAIERKPLLTSMKEELELFPVAGGGTLLDIATAFLEAGEALHRKLSERADVPRVSRKAATVIRPVTIGILNRFRADLIREIKRDPSLPRDLEHRVFGYFETLESMHPSPERRALGEAHGDAPRAGASEAS